GRTIIVVTHDLKVAGHCQREIYMRDGKVAEPDVAAIRSSEPVSVSMSTSPNLPPAPKADPATKPLEARAKSTIDRPGGRQIWIGLAMLAGGASTSILRPSRNAETMTEAERGQALGSGCVSLVLFVAGLLVVIHGLYRRFLSKR
ncbi:MAG TPA: hypothetical protein VHM90_00475, partial [Phycisphaerae bacterium]|nr:hypothetical protein [Phycisphaerae bacterium]